MPNVYNETMARISEKGRKISEMENTSPNKGSISRAKAMAAIIERNPVSANKIVNSEPTTGNFHTSDFESFSASSGMLFEEAWANKAALGKLGPKQVEGLGKGAAAKAKISVPKTKPTSDTPDLSSGLDDFTMENLDFDLTGGLVPGNAGAGGSNAPTSRKPLIVAGGVVLAIVVLVVLIKKLKKK